MSPDHILCSSWQGAIRQVAIPDNQPRPLDLVDAESRLRPGDLFYSNDDNTYPKATKQKLN